MLLKKDYFSGILTNVDLLFSLAPYKCMVYCMAQEITEKQKKILSFIMDFRNEKGYPPTLAEIAGGLGYVNRSTVQQHIESLQKKGWLIRNKNTARGIELTLEDKYFYTGQIMGEIAAGNPIAIYPDSIDTIQLPTVVRMPKDSFLLRVKGNSLKDAYIFDGDIIIVNPNIVPKDGHIVAAVLDNEALVKRFEYKEGVIILHSENPEYRPVYIEEGKRDLKIAGVVVGVYRSMQMK